MLMRYAVHLAGGHGIVWNIGEAPVDGATDFLFMVSLAGVVKAGLDAGTAVKVLGFVAHTITVLLVYAGIVAYFGGRRLVAILTAGFLACGPGLRYVEAYFGTPLFAMFAALTWFLALALITRPRSRAAPPLFALAALATGLVRPEGVFLAVFMLGSVVYATGGRRAAGAVVWFASVFAILGGAYLVWRKVYFGYFLPNPFYAKGGGALHPISFEAAIENVSTLLLPFLPVLAIAIVLSVVSLIKTLDRTKLERLLRWLGVGALALFALGLARSSDPAAHEVLVLGRYSSKYAAILGFVLAAGAAALIASALVHRLLAGTLPRVREPATDAGSYLEHVRRWTLIALIPVAGYTAIWILIRDVMNYLMRFQYAVLPVVCMVWPAFLMGAGRAFPGLRLAGRRAQFGAIAVSVAVVAGTVFLQRSMMTVSDGFHDGRYDMALMLRDYASEDYTMATTEAGLLPYYSQWNAVDIWGFNDKWIAHHTQVTDSYLDRYRPELVILATKFPLDEPPGAPGSWYSVLGTAKRYAERRDYVLAAAYGADASKVHYYYVRSGFEHSAEIIGRIQSLEYTWYLNGRPAVDFAADPRR